MKYLNPKADLTFKKVFGEHPDLMMSLLNALLPFESLRAPDKDRRILQAATTGVFAQPRERRVRARPEGVLSLLSTGTRRTYGQSNRRLAPHLRRTPKVYPPHV